MVLDLDGLQEGNGNTGPQDGGPCTQDGDCNDSIDCTTDTCRDDGTCSTTPDNDKCGYLEMCDLQEGCRPTGKNCKISIDCDDQLDCTEEKCVNGKCQNVPDHALCEDTTNLCIVERTCALGIGCTEGKNKICDQSGLGACRQNVCEPATGNCVEEATQGADNDGDGFLDHQCGGDDCADMDQEAHPDAEDMCNFSDDNCDGLTDISVVFGPETVIQSQNLYSPAVAYDGERFIVVWQQGLGTKAEVYAQVLGTGECLVDTGCEDPASGAIEAINLTPKGGIDSAGSTPAVVAFGAEFLIAWIAAPVGQGQEVRLIGLDYDADLSTVSVWDQAKTLSTTDDSDQLFGLQLDRDGGGTGWRAAWGRQYQNGNVAVELTDNEMVASAATQFTGNRELGQIGRLSITCLEPGDCIVAFSFKDTFAGANLEVHEARFEKSGDTWYAASGWPKIISNSSSLASDPSYDPFVTPLGNGEWVTGFTDVRAISDLAMTESESDVRGVRSAQEGSVIDLYQDDMFNQLIRGFVYGSDGFGLLYLQEANETQLLDFRLLDDALTRIPKQGARLLEVDTGEIRTGNLIWTSKGFATAWIDSPGTGTDTLTFLAFLACQPIT